MSKNKKRPRQANKAARKKQKNHDDFFPEEEPGFSFVAGYTSWGFPYGTLVEDEEEDTAPLKDEELPF